MTRSFQRQDAGKSFPLLGSFSVGLDEVVTVEVEGEEVEVSDVVIVPEDHVHTFDDFFQLIGSSLFAILDDGSLLGPVPVQRVGDGRDGFAVLLWGGERLVLGSAGIAPGQTYEVQFKASDRKDLRCGFMDAGARVTSTFDCRHPHGVRRTTGSEDAFLFIEVLESSDEAPEPVEIDDITVVMESEPDEGEGPTDPDDDGDDDAEPCPPNGCAVPLGELALYAAHQMNIGDRVVVRQGSSPAAVGYAGTQTLRIGTDTRLGDVWSEGSVQVGDRSVVDGSIRSEGTVAFGNGASATGGSIQVTLDWQPLASFEVAFPTQNQGDVSVAPDSSRVLAPGAYAAVAVYSRSELQMSNGNYFFDRLILEPQSRLVVGSGSVRLHVRDAFIFRGSIASATNPPDLTVIYQGTSGAFIEAPFQGHIVTTRGLLQLHASPGPHTGSFWGHHVEVQPGLVLEFFPREIVP